MPQFSISNIRATARQFSPLELGAILVVALGAILLFLYWFGTFDAWRESRHWKQEFDAQQKIADDEKKKREAAEANAAQFQQQAQEANAEAQKWKGVSDEIRNQMSGALQDLEQRRAATAESSRAYDAVRARSRAPRPPVPDDELRRRLREGAEQYRRDGND